MSLHCLSHLSCIPYNKNTYHPSCHIFKSSPMFLSKVGPIKLSDNWINIVSFWMNTWVNILVSKKTLCICLSLSVSLLAYGAWNSDNNSYNILTLMACKYRRIFFYFLSWIFHPVTYYFLLVLSLSWDFFFLVLLLYHFLVFLDIILPFSLFKTSVHREMFLEPFNLISY